MDPVECGQPALDRALAELDRDTHELVVLVIATEPPAAVTVEFETATDDPTALAFRHARSQLSAYRRAAEAAGFTVSGWVAPPRKLQFTKEGVAQAPYSYALSVAPSGAWRGLTGRDAARLLEAADVPTELRCTTR